MLARFHNKIVFSVLIYRSFIHFFVYLSHFERVFEFIHLSLNFRATENSKITKTSQNNPVNPQIYQDCLLYPNITHDIPKDAIITLYFPLYTPQLPAISRNIPRLLSQSLY
jgi:hypothetical protein